MRVERFRGSGGVTLVADVGGDPDGPVVILMHGGGQTRHSWGTAARDLVESGHYVVSLDLRGHGESDWAPDGDYSISAFVADLREVIARMPGPPALVGASLGGMTALLTVGETAEPVARALVLVDIVPRIEPEGAARIQAFMQAHPHGFASLEEVADAVASYMTHRPRPSNIEGLRRNVRVGPDGRLYWHWDPRLLANASQRMAEDLPRLPRAAAAVRIPTLLVRGRLSDVVSDAGVAELRRLIPHARVVDVAEAGHMVAGDQNDVFNAAVEEFLRELDENPPRLGHGGC